MSSLIFLVCALRLLMQVKRVHRRVGAWEIKALEKVGMNPWGAKA